MYGMSGEHPYIMKTGTSMAAPVVSGAAACLLSKYPDMTNVEIKLKLRESCVKIERDRIRMGNASCREIVRL